MLLADATSREEVERALAAGDDELCEDIEEQLDESREWWRLHVGEMAENQWDFTDYVQNTSFVEEVIAESPPEYDLSTVPPSSIADALSRASGVRGQRERQYQIGPFTTDRSLYRYRDAKVTFSAYTTDDYYFPGGHLPENAEFIPEDMAVEFWKSVALQYIEWSETTTLDSENGNTGWAEGNEVTIYADKDEFAEWCRDIINEYVDNVIKEDPAAAKKVFLSGLAAADSALAAKLAAAGPPDEELLDFAAQWFRGEDEQKEVLETIVDYFGALEGGAGEERAVLAEWSRDGLRAMGITKGPLFEEAPWRLVKLHPSDLRVEGALMRHCVGDKGMGYIRALRDGEIELWSLRSRANKPRFTLEVDAGFYAEADGSPRTATGVPWEELRGRAIKQLKGKANRTPGYADVREGSLQLPDEVIFWDHALRQLGVDPQAVDDFRAAPGIYDARQALRPNGTGQRVGFDMPYRPLRRNRRTSKRRGSKRRTSRRSS